MKYALIFFKVLIVLICLAAYIYSFIKSDGTFLFYLQFSLLLNFLLVLLFSISTREDQQLNRMYYKIFPISKVKLIEVRVIRLLSNPFYLTVFLLSLSILLDANLSLLQRVLYIIIFNSQFVISLLSSILIYDILQTKLAEKQFILIPLMLISITNISVQMNVGVNLLLLDFFGGFVFMPFALLRSFDLIVLGGFIFYTLLFYYLFKIYKGIEG